VIVALAAVDHALEAFEVADVGDEGFGGIAGLRFRMLSEKSIGRLFPENGFDATHAAEAPFVVNQGIDEEALVGVGGAVVLVVFGGELGEIVGGFVEHDLVVGMDAVLEGVEAGCGFAGGGARAGGFLRIGAAGRGLFGSRHGETSIRFDASRRFWGWKGQKGLSALERAENKVKNL